MRSLKRLLVCCVAVMMLGLAAACAKNGPVVPDTPLPEPVYALTFPQREYVLATVQSGHTVSASAVLTKDGEAAEGTVRYTVKDPAVAAYSEGTLTAAAAGQTTLTASCEAGGKTLTATAAVTVLAETTADRVNSLDDVSLFGRTYLQSGQLMLDNVCTGVEVAFAGTSLSCKFGTSARGKVRYFVDGDTEGTPYLFEGSGAQTLRIEGLEEGVHVVRILKAASTVYGTVSVAAKPFATDGVFLTPPPKSDLKIEFLGDSITAGCGAIGKASEKEQTVENSDPTKAYAYLTAQRLGADFSVIALEGMCIKDTSTCGYDAYLSRSVSGGKAYDGPFDADVVVLALAENDMWHATSDQSPDYNLAKLTEDYKSMLQLLREKNPDAYIVCVFGMMPASKKSDCRKLIEGVVSDLGDNKISTLSMLCDETGANSHPNSKAHSTNADKLAEHIRKLIP